MNYNLEHLDPAYAIIKVFLNNAVKNVLDISYDLDAKNIDIQVVYLNGTKLPDTYLQKIQEALPDFNIQMKTVPLSQAAFSEAGDNWAPVNYSWKKHLLFSKSAL